MRSRIFHWGLLFFSALFLLIGIQYPHFWIAGGLLGLIPAITWFFNDLRHKTMGSDVLAILSIAGALLTDELLAAAVISLMLATLEGNPKFLLGFFE